MNYLAHIDSPIGVLRLSADERALTGLDLGADARAAVRANGARAAPIEDPRAGPLPAAIRQLGEYFAGARRAFDLPLSLAGTPFQRLVWQALTEIPYGATWSYGELARRIGRPAAARAVGMANHRNPLPIIVPCHRVIGADGSMTGYGGGIARKEWLLGLERAGEGRACLQVPRDVPRSIAGLVAKSS
jgi:methylated-DNA-[protein]-cysteine S-methyltransferase